MPAPSIFILRIIPSPDCNHHHKLQRAWCRNTRLLGVGSELKRAGGELRALARAPCGLDGLRLSGPWGQSGPWHQVTNSFKCRQNAELPCLLLLATRLQFVAF